MKIGKQIAEWAKANDISFSYFEEVESTNLQILKENTKICVTDYQSRGLGRGKNTWVSPQSGDAILMSILFETDFLPQPIASPLFGLACYQAFLKLFPEAELSIKAPNDLYCKDKKIGGILLQNIAEGNNNQLVFGLGVNIFSHPSIENSEALQNFHPQKIDSSTINELLNEIWQNAGLAAEKSKEKELNSDTCQALLSALQKNPVYEKKIEKISSDSSIHFTDGSYINWSDL